MNVVYLALGSNIGNKKRILSEAESLINEKIGTVIHASSVHTTNPEGFISTHKFLNKVICVYSILSPQKILETILEIEKKLGRNAKSIDGNYQDRTIDIDILYYNDSIINVETLTVPHPHLHTRMFVLKPLLEIAPELIHPILQLSTKQMLLRLEKED